MKLFLYFILFYCSANAQEWSYKGIPYTDWSYDPFTIEYSRPVSWDTVPTTETTDKYYIDPDDPAATDVGNVYGHPDLPRATFPVDSWIGDIFPAGTVFYMSGNFTAVEFGGVADYNPTLSGTGGDPIFFVGDQISPPKISGLKLQLIDSAHVIFDGLHWDGGNPTNTVLSMARSDRFFDTHHITIKNCRFENLDYIAGGAGMVTLTGPTGNFIHDVVCYNNVIKGCGGGFDWNASDGDHHGFHPGANAYRIWVIENDVQKGDVADPLDGIFKALSGNLVQVGGNTNDRTKLHHVYAAGNTANAGGLRQALLWTKNSSYVIFSENYCNRAGETFAADNGQCYGSQYDAEHHWFIFNVAENALAGWMHTDDGGQRTGPHVIYGNVFKNINSDGLNAVNSFDRACISLWNTQNDTYIINNTMYNIENAVAMNAISPTATMYIKNNLMHTFQGTEQRQLGIGGITGSMELENNTLYTLGTFTSRIDGTTYSDLSSLNGRADTFGNLDSDPLLVNPPTNVSIAELSDAIDAGTSATDMPALFVTTFSGDPDYPGTPNISFDIAGIVRPQNGDWDIGAYEYLSGGLVTAQSLTLQTLIVN